LSPLVGDAGRRHRPTEPNSVVVRCRTLSGSVLNYADEPDEICYKSDKFECYRIPCIYTEIGATTGSRFVMVDTDRLLTPGEVAQLFGVNRQTVSRWATRGFLGVIVTPGGHRRSRESEVNALLEDSTARDV
jgi:excisionase family DNA binding protein